MVNEDMHPIELRLISALENDEPVRVADLGGLDALLAASAALSVSPLVDEFAKIVATDATNSDEETKNKNAEFLCICFEHATSDFALPLLIDILDVVENLPHEVADKIFVRCINLAEDKMLRPIARSAGLDGALRWTMRKGAPASRKHKLTACLVGIDLDDDKLLLCRVTAVMGVCYSHWLEQDIKSRLRLLCDIEHVREQATFELAVVNLEDALRSNNSQTSKLALEASKFWLQRTAEASTSRPDAAIYLLCIDALFAFAVAESEIDAVERLNSISKMAFDLAAYHDCSSDAPWLGARNLAISHWAHLGQKLHECTITLGDGYWYHPEVLIRDHLLATLQASRTILHRDKGGVVDEIVRPQILRSLHEQPWQAAAIRKWIQLNGDSGDVEIAKSLLEDVASSETKAAPQTFVHTNRLSDISHLLSTRNFTESARAELQCAIADAHMQYLTDLSESAVCIFEACLSRMGSHPDYASNKNGKSLFRSVLLWTISFLESRNNMGKRDAPVGYLFERSSEELAKEHELQQDYSQMVRSMVGHGARIEMPNISGGRSDVWFKLGGEHLVVEVKRELSDASFDALQTAYSTQASEYQNTSIRLGFVLVLDLTKKRSSGSIHISELVQARQLVRSGESQPRWIVFVKVPGRRLAPHELR